MHCHPNLIGMSQFAPKRIVDYQSEVTSGGKLFRRQSFSGSGRTHSQDEDYVLGNGKVHSVSPTPPTSIPNSPLYDNDSPDSPLSPPIFRTQSYDEVLFDIRKVPPDKIAAQLTLIDLPLFKAIRMEELTNTNWTKKDKLTLAPNVVAFTKRFNHTSFWVVREILNQDQPRVRAEVITQFIKIAKKLFELNNIHSLKAVLSGLQSGPIFRLSQTWRLVNKKDRGTMERSEDFLSSDENWKTMRLHMDEARLPCIPHLGMYLTDLSFISSMPSKDKKEDAVRNIIAYFQNSEYDYLVPEVHVRKYLLHRWYIDELQKFFEDDNYKLSQQCEPDPVNFRKPRSVSTAVQSSISTTPLRISKSHEDLLSPFSKTQDTLSESESKWSSHKHLASTQSTCSESKIRVTIQADSPSIERRKNCTLPTNFRGVSFSSTDMKHSSRPRPHEQRIKSTPNEGGAMDLLTPTESPKHSLAGGRGRGVVSGSPALKRKFSRGHKKAHSLGSNVLSMLGMVKHSNPSPSNSRDPSPSHSPSQSRSLLDDSPLDTSFIPFGSPSGSVGNVSLSSPSSDESGDEEDALYKKLDDVDELEVDYMQAVLVMEGPLKRKVVKRNGKSVLQLKGWSKAWVQLTDSSLLLLPSKPKTKKMSKPVRIKGMTLRGWGVKYKEDKTNEKHFILYNETGSQVKFSAKASSVTEVWVDRISRVIQGEEERERKKAEQSLIKL